jgi:hypothetical protein
MRNKAKMSRNEVNDSGQVNDAKDRPASARPGLDGRRIRLADLQGQVTQPAAGEVSESRKHWLKRCWAACNDFLAGMYTGESCAGTPHSERGTSVKEKNS